jgi:chromosome segregation ATPase
MKALIDEEARLDKEQKEWCESETSTNEGTLEDKKSLIDTLEGEINDLVTSIEDPETGLKQQIKDTEEGLDENAANQATEKDERKQAHTVYKKETADTAEAAALMTRAVKVLKKYYAAQEKFKEKAEELLQKKDEPAPPDTFESNSFEGQKESGNKVIEMLEFIIEETKKEEDALHKGEEDDVKAFEESMATLKEEEETLQTTLVDTKKTLVETELELEGKREDLSVTTHEKEAIEAYLLKIKPGCDFIKDNYEDRENARGEEMNALDKAVELLKETPAFKAAADGKEE